MRVRLISSLLAGALVLCGCAKTECPQGSVFVPAGTFVMGTEGTEKTWVTWQLKPRTVTLTKSYCMDRTEVTYGAYDACGAAKVCGWQHGPYPEAMRKLPKAFVDWADADKYCRWRGGRLPTEAEWEHAARYPDGRLYAWGNEPPTLEHWHWRGDLSIPREMDVGSHPKGRSYLGLEDMAGSLGEWVRDEYGVHTPQPDIDPTGPDDGKEEVHYRTVRGGSWASLDERMAPATHRQPGDRVYGDDQTGFRCAYAPR
ncbi:MAG TPA: SUMF1/EgtB/PvdO family nonheme iron enzyme [Polyangiales bacterium]|nr:SUMF1/EgtB/PvdO family nonheme iron enzyme [Polyangiales bacterium]